MGNSRERWSKRNFIRDQRRRRKEGGGGAGELVLHEGERALKVTIINAALSDESIYNQHYYTARSLRPIREGITCKSVDGQEPPPTV